MFLKKRKHRPAPRSLMVFAGLAKQGAYKLAAEEKAGIAESKAQARRGEVATNEEVEAAYSRFRDRGPVPRSE